MIMEFVKVSDIESIKILFEPNKRVCLVKQTLGILQPKNDHFFSGKSQFFVQKSTIL